MLFIYVIQNFSIWDADLVGCANEVINIIDVSLSPNHFRAEARLKSHDA
jgi:hypothetical protein